jgi:hypothetical protein
MKASDQVFAFPLLDLTVTWQSKLRNSKSRNSIYKRQKGVVNERVRREIAYLSLNIVQLQARLIAVPS